MWPFGLRHCWRPDRVLVSPMASSSASMLQLSVTSRVSEAIFPLSVPSDLSVENLKALCEAESGIPVDEMLVLFRNEALDDDKKSVAQCGIADQDIIVLDKKKKQSQPNLPDFSQIRLPGTSNNSSRPANSLGSGQEDDPQWIRRMLMANPDQLAILKQNNPRLAEALDSGNLELFSKILKEQQAARAERDRERLRLLTSDPFDMEAQRLIAQEIEKKNIDHNMELAMEYSPESFGTVVMLYIDCKVNGHHIKAFVDSGAQATIMSARAAEKCGIMRLVDKRWAGIAKGVGTQRIIGRVHMAQIQIEDAFLSSSFSILEEQPMDMLLGLDMLKRHQCSIDLKENVLKIGSTGTQTPFLNESELPPCARLSGANEATMADAEEAMIRQAIKASSEEPQKRPKIDDNTSSDIAKSASSANIDGAGSSSSGLLASDRFSEKEVQTLMKYGFERQKCIDELRANNGDVTQATAALFAKSLKF